MANPDQSDYHKYMGRARLDKPVNTLLGILQGIATDFRIAPSELTLLGNWLYENIEFANKHPFNELIPPVQSGIADGYLDKEEQLDLIWLCEKLKSTEYFNALAAGIQSLHGILAGIVSDGMISQSEIVGLIEWLNDHEHLWGCWPYDEISSLITGILADKEIDDAERKLLKSFFGDFVGTLGSPAISKALTFEGSSINGLCAVCPEISFPNSIFCFTGISAKHPREELLRIVEDLKGVHSKIVTQEVDYLVIGAGANPCWAYACYGRKVEQAVALRKQGFKLLLVHENDFLDAAADAEIQPLG